MTALLPHGESTVKRLGHLRHRRLPTTADGTFENAQAVTVQEIQSIDR
ncbi:hypothetical protein ACGFZZ_00785 [Streptomyces tendae]